MELRKKVRDSIKMRDGERFSLGAEWGKVWVHVRAMGGAYADDLAKRRRDLFKEFGGEDVPTDRDGQAQIEALIARVLVDAGSDDPADTIDGKPVTLDTLTALMREPGASSLANAVIVAASKVGLHREETKRVAEGN